MKNYEKYATVKEQEKAFEDLCYKQYDCYVCPVDREKEVVGCVRCSFVWLNMEADEPPQWQSNILNKFNNKE